MADKRKQRGESWRRHLTSGNIGGVLFIVGIIVVIASVLLIGYNLSLAAGERNEQLWKDKVIKLVRDARRADDTWIMIPHLVEANQILIDNGYEPTLDEFIERAEEIENSWGLVIYRKGFYLLKQDLSEWPAPDISRTHSGEVVTWIIGLFAGFAIGWIGWGVMGSEY